MRYYELNFIEPGPHQIDRPPFRRRPFHGDVKLVIRFAPCVYRWININLNLGDPAAEVGIDRAAITFPEVYDGAGALTRDCRRWIIEVVHKEVERLGLSICIVLGPEDAVYCHPGGILGISERLPEGGLRV